MPSEDVVGSPGWQPRPPGQSGDANGAGPRRARREPTMSSPSSPSPDSSPDEPTEETTSSRSTSSSPTEPEERIGPLSDPGALTGLLAELLKGASALASMWTRRHYGLDLKMREGEARAVASRIAKIVQRRWEVRSDLNDATDVAGAGGSVISWVERVLSGQTAPGAQAPLRRIDGARSPTSAVLLSDEGQAGPLPDSGTIHESAEVHDQSGAAVPGSGPVRGAFLEGFEEP